MSGNNGQVKLTNTLTVLLLLSGSLTACHFKEDLKAVGDGIQEGVHNAGEAIKRAPADISEASNKVEAEMRDR